MPCSQHKQFISNLSFIKNKLHYYLNQVLIIMPAIILGSHPAADFLNTIASPSGTPVEFIGNGEQLLVWLVEAGLIDQAQHDWLKQHHSSKVLDGIAQKAREEREWARQWLQRWRNKPQANHNKEIAHLNQLLALGPVVKELKSDHAGGTSVFTENWQLQMEKADSLLALIAGTIASLLAHEDPALFRDCAGTGCTLSFLDRTKSHRRLFCSAAVCGNRAKVAAFRERQKQK